MNDALILIGRIGLALIFVLSGFAKIGGYAGTQQYMELPQDS
jgi:putative oxidoreductase